MAHPRLLREGERKTGSCVARESDVHVQSRAGATAGVTSTWQSSVQMPLERALSPGSLECSSHVNS